MTIASDSPYNAIIVLSGGATKNGNPNGWGRRRLDRAADIYKDIGDRRTHIITCGGGTPHQMPELDLLGRPIPESLADAKYLADEHGIDTRKIIPETLSRDTMGNAYFSRAIHVIPRGWTRLLVVTSEFHRQRAEKVFNWIYGLSLDMPCRDSCGLPESSARPYVLDFEQSDDFGIDADTLVSLGESERTKIARLENAKMYVKTLEDLHAWLYAQHDQYATEHQIHRVFG